MSRSCDWLPMCSSSVASAVDQRSRVTGTGLRRQANCLIAGSANLATDPVPPPGHLASRGDAGVRLRSRTTMQGRPHHALQDVGHRTGHHHGVDMAGHCGRSRRRIRLVPLVAQASPPARAEARTSLCAAAAATIERAPSCGQTAETVEAAAQTATWALTLEAVGIALARSTLGTAAWAQARRQARLLVVNLFSSSCRVAWTRA